MANDILVKIGADISDFSRKMNESSRALEDFSKANQQTFDAFRQTGAAVTGAGVALSAGLGFAVKTAADFESGMSQVAAISGATGEEFEALEARARELGGSTSFSAKEAADGLQYLALAGWDTTQMIDGLEPVLHLAEAGALDLGRSADLVTDSMSALGLVVDDLDGYLDQVAATSSNANSDIDALMEAMVIAGGTFDRFNVPLEEANAFLGVLANRGFKGSEAGTALNAIMARLTSGTGEAATALEEMGISAFDSEGNFRGMEEVMYDVKGALDGMDDEQRAHYQTMLAGLNHGKTFSAMLEGLGGEYQDLKGDIKDSDGALKEMRDIMKDNLQGALENLISAFEEVMISLGTALLPVVKTLVGWLQNLADWFNNLSDRTKTVIAVIAAVAAGLALVIGPILMLVGFIPMIVMGFAALGTVIAALTSPITLVVAALIAAVVAIIIYWEPIKEFFINLWESIKEITIAVWESLVDVWNAAVEWLKEIWQGVSEWFAELWESIVEIFTTVWDSLVEEWNAFVELIKEIFTPIKEFFVEVWEGVKETFTSVWDTLTEMLSSVWDNIKSTASSAWELIKNVILGPILLLIDLVTGDMEGFKSNLSAIWNNIKDAASRIWENLKDAVRNIVDGLVDAVVKLWEGFKDTLSTIMNGIKDTASEVWENIKTSISDLAQGAKDAAVEAWETLKEKTSEAFNKVVDFITEPLEDIDLFQIGKDIIQGLIDGVGSLASAVWDKATSIAEGIGGAIKSALGIASPSRLMIQFGKWTGEGLAVGIEGMTGVVGKADDKLADAAVPKKRGISMEYDIPKTRGVNTSVSRGDFRTNQQAEGFNPRITNNFTPAESTPSESARKQKQALQRAAMDWGFI